MRLDYLTLNKKLDELKENGIPVDTLLSAGALEIIFIDSQTFKNKDFVKGFLNDDDFYQRYLYRFEEYFPIVGCNDVDSSIKIGLAFIVYNPKLKERNFVTFNAFLNRYSNSKSKS